MRDLNLALVMSLKDKLVVPLNRAISQAERGFKDLEKTASATARSSATVADNLQKVGRQASSTRQAAQEMRNLGKEAERTGRELTRLERLRAGATSLGRGATRTWAASTAFSHVVADPLRQAADFDTQLRQLSNTAYAGRSLADRRAGMGTLNAAITNAVRFGGGKREDALSALNELVASGEFKEPAEAAAVLPSLMRGSTASGADAAQLATIAIRARQSMGIRDAKGLAGVLDMAMAAGQAGGFELRDMAKWLPQQMAVASGLGMSGMQGITDLLAANQAAVITAGSRDEAGNNLVNLLAKINSRDTAKDFADQGIDLTGSLSKARGKGMNALDAFVALVDKVASSDPKFVQAKQAASKAQGSDKAAAMEAQAKLLEGSSVGRVIQDRQALMALIALMNNRGYVGKVKGEIAGSTGAVENAFGLMKEGAGYIFDQRQFEVQRAQTEAMSTANSAVTELAKAQIDLYQRYPGFAEALEGAKVAVSGFAAATAAAGAATLLTGGGRAATAAGVGKVASVVKTGATAAAGTLGIGALAAVAAPILAASNENRPFVEAAADPMVMGGAGMADVMSDRLAQPVNVQVQVHLDGRQIESAVTSRQDQMGKRK
jgi:hypothetical protein